MSRPSAGSKGNSVKNSKRCVNNGAPPPNVVLSSDVMPAKAGIQLRFFAHEADGFSLSLE
jgi:hypothetical protein